MPSSSSSHFVARKVQRGREILSIDCQCGITQMTEAEFLAHVKAVRKAIEAERAALERTEP